MHYHWYQTRWDQIFKIIIFWNWDQNAHIEKCHKELFLIIIFSRLCSLTDLILIKIEVWINFCASHWLILPIWKWTMIATWIMQFKFCQKLIHWKIKLKIWESNTKYKFINMPNLYSFNCKKNIDILNIFAWLEFN